MLRLYLITPEGDALPALRAALAALREARASGTRPEVLVQLRRKQAGAGELYTEARRLLPVCREHGAKLLVNDRADVALAACADGVHLPANGLSPEAARQLLGPASLVAVSCHTSAEVAAAAQAGADFCVFGPVFETPGKRAQGLPALREAARAAAIPVLALGGVSPENARAALAAGAQGVAVIRSVLGASDPAAAALELWAALT